MMQTCVNIWSSLQPARLEQKIRAGLKAHQSQEETCWPLVTDVHCFQPDVRQELYPTELYRRATAQRTATLPQGKKKTKEDYARQKGRDPQALITQPAPGRTHAVQVLSLTVASNRQSEVCYYSMRPYNPSAFKLQSAERSHSPYLPVGKHQRVIRSAL
eukprot:1160963-Pelagomonas_calceolata.AAC.11